MSRVGRWLAGAGVLVVAIIALVLALGGSLSHTSGRDATVAAATKVSHVRSHHARHTSAPTATTPSSPTLTPAGGPGGRAQQRLTASMRRWLAMAGPSVGALVFDIDTRRELFGDRPTVARPPGSVEKLWTTTALLDRLGPDARLHTVILGTGRKIGGVWHGDLYLRGGGDPTFGDAGFNAVWNHGEGANAAQLVAQLQRRGIRRVTGRVYADESLFDSRRGGLLTGQRPDIPDLGGQLSALTYDHGTTLRHYTPATFAAHEVVLTMRGAHIAATAARRARRTPDDAQLLASVASPPLSAMVRLMDVPSDDLFAELFCKQLGVLYGRGGTIAAGAQVIARTIASDYALHPRILDGSGLSHRDRASPLQVVELLRDLWRTPVGDELQAALPTTGVSGTLTSIGARGPAQGRCEAKTGSLDDVTNLAGWCRARGGHELAFAVFVDGPDNATGFALESRMVDAIARY